MDKKQKSMNLTERKENLYRYLKLNEPRAESKQTIRGNYGRMDSGRMTKSLTNERDNRTSNKLKTSM